MGTRGCYGFRKNGIDKLTYNHFDSYPSGLGRDILSFCKHTSLAEMNEIYDRIILVHENEEPTSDQIAECSYWFNGDVSNRTPKDWYCLLRNAQGDLNAYKTGLKYMIENNDFIQFSLHCEYGYIINLDTKKLEFWVGYQKTPDESNRYGTNADRMGYYPCKMVKEYSLLPRYMGKRDVDKTVEDMEKKSR